MGNTIYNKMKKIGRVACGLLLVATVGLCACSPDQLEQESSSSDTASETEGVTGSNERPAGEKWVALTFDDGPGLHTKKIVDEMEKYGFHATFFVLGNRIDGSYMNYGESMAYAAEHGNEIAIHGYTHAPGLYYDDCDDETYRNEIEKTEQAIRDVLPDHPIRLMRPFGGYISEERAAASEYGIAMWSVDSDDWRHTYKPGDGEAEWTSKVNTIVDNVMSQVQDGSVILMHDIYESTYDATVILLQQLHEEGYKVVTMSQLLGGEPTPGQMYYDAHIKK